MDYVLERFKLPAPLLNKNILDAIFPLDPVKSNHDEFMKKIIQGIIASKEFLEKLST